MTSFGVANATFDQVYQQVSVLSSFLLFVSFKIYVIRVGLEGILGKTLGFLECNGCRWSKQSRVE